MSKITDNGYESVLTQGSNQTCQSTLAELGGVLVDADDYDVVCEEIDNTNFNFHSDEQESK